MALWLCGRWWKAADNILCLLFCCFVALFDVLQDGSGSIDFEEFLDMMTAKMVC